MLVPSLKCVLLLLQSISLGFSILNLNFVTYISRIVNCKLLDALVNESNNGKAGVKSMKK